jgi:carboxyl-terminal processing protease
MELGTVQGMLKRILSVATGVLLGTALALGAARLAAHWGLLPGSDLDRSAAYVRDVLQIVNENYVEEPSVDYQALTRSALEGLMSSLDPHSDFMEATAYRALQEDMSNEFGGIGVQVEMRDEKVVVIAPIAGTPGERAGILRGDQIVSVDGARLESPSMDEVIRQLRGKPRTQVAIGIHRPDTNADLTLTLVREVIKLESVGEARMLDGGIGYLRLAQFSERTGEEFAAALERLTAEGMTSLVLDLRNNPGGLLDAAVAVAEPFFQRDELIVYTQGRRPENREEYRSSRKGDRFALPVAVLINAGSASAAEIVAGALKDTGRAVIVGERSFGKGSVQSIFRLRNGEGLRLTTARYYTPSGTTIHERGVEPHVEVVMTPAEDGKVRLQRARDDITDPLEFKERFGFEPVVDRQLEAALDVLQTARLLESRTLANRG